MAFYPKSNLKDLLFLWCKRQLRILHSCCQKGLTRRKIRLTFITVITLFWFFDAATLCDTLPLSRRVLFSKQLIVNVLLLLTLLYELLDEVSSTLIYNLMWWTLDRFCKDQIMSSVWFIYHLTVSVRLKKFTKPYLKQYIFWYHLGFLTLWVLENPLCGDSGISTDV